MKKMISLFLCVLLVSAMFTGCAKTETPAENPAPATDAETPADGAEAKTCPAPFEAVAYGIAEGKTEKDYALAGVFGAVNPYSDPMPGAAEQATQEIGIPAADFNAPQDWVQNDQNTILDALVSKGIKGIYMMPSDPVAGNEQIGKMVDAGVPVVCVGGAPATPSKATLTLATDVYQAAFDGTTNLIEAMGGKGGVVGLNGAVTDPNTQSRMKAIEDACAAYPDVTLVQAIGDIDDSELSYSAIENILAAKGDQINGFISTCYYPSVALASILAEEKYADIHAIGCDTDEAVLDGIRAGSLDGTMSQNPWGQAYLATITLKMLLDGWVYNGEFMVDSGSFYINADNVDAVADTQMSETLKLAADWTSHFTAPQ